MVSRISVQGFLLFVFLFRANVARAQDNIFNVQEHGAVPDGKTENSEAFADTWNQACQYPGGSTFLVPKGSFLLNAIVFRGPCKGPIQFEVQGNLIAQKYGSSPLVDHWLSFRYMDHLSINGQGGSWNGQGPSAWPHKGCKGGRTCKLLPISLRFDFVNDSRIDYLTLINSQDKHIKIFGSNNIHLTNIRIRAPGKSPNTDGIYIAKSTNVDMTDSNIGTGDDCICFGPGARDINITNVNCGPGHGISVGSLGSSNNEAAVSGLNVGNCTFKRTQNGLRIKTWERPYPGLVSDIKFEHIIMQEVSNPIIIDQHYCPNRGCPKGESRVQITDVGFNDISGTSKTDVTVNIQCSSLNPCQNIELTDIKLYSHDKGKTTTICKNVNEKGANKCF